MEQVGGGRWVEQVGGVGGWSGWSRCVEQRVLLVGGASLMHTTGGQ